MAALSIDTQERTQPLSLLKPNPDQDPPMYMNEALTPQTLDTALAVVGQYWSRVNETEFIPQLRGYLNLIEHTYEFTGVGL